MATTVVEEDEEVDFAVQIARDPYTVKAVPWLRGGTPDQPRSISPDMPNDASIEFVEKLEKMGAVKVSLAGYGSGTDSSLRPFMVIELPVDPMQRQRIFDFVELDRIQHCNPAIPDRGQTHIVQIPLSSQCECDDELEDDDY